MLIYLNPGKLRIGAIMFSARSPAFPFLVFLSLLFYINTAVFAESIAMITYDSTTQKNGITIWDSVSNVSAEKITFKFPSGGWQASNSFTTDDALWLKDGSSGFMVYNYATNLISHKVGGVQSGGSFGIPRVGQLVSSSDSGSLKIENTKGETVIETRADGSTHIGENSLVTIEENGAQSLYATDANGNTIDINIVNGSNLLINGNPISSGPTLKEVRKYDSRSVALSAALTALPTQSEGSSHACGIGSGVRGNYSAMAIGCAADLENFKLFDGAPSFIKNASINVGTSFLTHDDPDYTFKAGLTWNFGKSKSKGYDLSESDRVGARSAIAEQKNALAINTLQKENKILMASNAELTRKLNVLIANNDRFLALSVKMELLAQQLETSDLILASR
jgi:hypothetical protein